MRHETFSGSLFLAVCILMTVSASMVLLDGYLNILSILYAISFWQLYSSSKKGKPLAGFRLGCGTIKATEIILWVVIGILIVCGILVMFVPQATVSTAVDMTFDIVDDFYDDDILEESFNRLGSTAFIWGGILMLVSAVGLAVVNMLYIRRLLIFVRTLEGSMDQPGRFPEETEPVRKWMMILGVLSCLGILGSMSGDYDSMQSVCRGACMIVGSVWIKNLDDYRMDDPIYESYHTNDSTWYS